MILYGAEGLTARDQAHRLLALAAAEHWGLSPLPAPGVLTLDGLHFRVYSGPGWRAAACGESPPPEEILWKDV